VRMMSGIQTDDDAYTSKSLFATSPTLSFTIGVIGAKEFVLDIVPGAGGPWPFGGIAIYTRECGGGGEG